MLRLDIPMSVARTCIPALNTAIAEASHHAAAARSDEVFRVREDRMCALDCLLHALNAAIRADEADCARKVAEAESRPPADCDPVTGQEYGTGA